MNLIYMDESGYTGPDLITTDQPILAVASLNIDPDEANELKQRHFAKTQMQELKHSKLSGGTAGQKMILGFLREISERPNIVKVEAAYKRYAIACKLVDNILEPLAAERGVDLYLDRKNVKLAYYVYHHIKPFLGEPAHDGLLNKFNDHGRIRNSESLELFLETLKRGNWPEKIEWLRKEFLLGAEATNGLHPDAEMQKIDFNLVLPSAIKLLRFWDADFGYKPIDLIFDKTAHLSRHPEHWNELTRPSGGTETFEYDGYTLRADLEVTTTFASSTDHVGLQLADVVAGASCRILSKVIAGGGRDEYDNELYEVITPLVKARSISVVVPDDGESTDSTFETSGLLGAVADHIARSRGEFPQKRKPDGGAIG